MNTVTSAVVGATALTATALLGLTGDDPAREEPPTDAIVLELARKHAEHKFVDIGRKGDTVGDRYLTALTLKSDGAVAGRLQNECTVLDSTYEGHLCTMALVLEGGQLVLASGGVGKPVPRIDGRGDAYAVTGGTGDYAGARGELVFAEDGRSMTITLVP